jgi:protein tyrosine phosphatase (PTP) superfamily phosphohydrolase (DUF442 family)
MTWNLRLVDLAEDENPYVEIREVYYNEIGKPIGHCTVTMGGEDKEEVKTYLKWALEALEKPVLKFGEMV